LSEQRVFALRGAVQAEANEREAILAATDELLRELIRRNDLEPARMISCIFTCTDDLDAEFPAVAARNLGLDAVPLLATAISASGGDAEAVAGLAALIRGEIDADAWVAGLRRVERARKAA